VREKQIEDVLKIKAFHVEGDQVNDLILSDQLADMEAVYKSLEEACGLS
jgi:hypothetical protein